MFAIFQSLMALVVSLFSRNSEKKRLEQLEKENIFDKAAQDAKDRKDASGLDGLF